MNGIHEVTGSIPVWSTKFSFGPSIGLKYLKADEVTAVRSNRFPLNTTPSGNLGVQFNIIDGAASVLLSWRIWETGIAADLLQCASLRRARKATHRSIGSADLFERAFAIREVVTQLRR